VTTYDTYEGDPAPPGARDVRYRVRWEPFWRHADDPEESESAGWLLEVGRLARVAGQLVRGWAEVGKFSDWRDAMWEATKDPTYRPPDYQDPGWEARDQLRAFFGLELWAHEATWSPVKGGVAYRCSQTWPDGEACTTVVAVPWTRSVCRRAVVGAGRAVPGL